MTTSSPSYLTDNFQRKVNYLRISVTDRCNLRCRYCEPSKPQWVEKNRLLTLEEIQRLVRIGIGLGICKVRLTGGEPLVRKGIVDLVTGLCRLEGLQDVSMTTNGTLLHHFGHRLREAGLRRLNISLDTLDRDKYQQMTGADLFSKVWDAILHAWQIGFAPVKINTVVMKGFNDGEIEDIAALSRKYPFHVRFIEYMPIGVDPVAARRYFMPVGEIEDRLRRVGQLIPVAGGSIDGPARRFRFKDTPGEIGLIGSMSHHFCQSCNRLRLTAAGQLRPCLLAEDHVNVLEPLRQGATDRQLENLFRQALQLKKERHSLNFEGAQSLQTKMVSIGG